MKWFCELSFYFASPLTTIRSLSCTCRAIKRSNRFHRNGHSGDCEASNTTNMIIFAGIQILLSQLPNFHKLWWLSIVAAVMSLAYSSIGLGLSIAKIAGPYNSSATLAHSLTDTFLL